VCTVNPSYAPHQVVLANLSAVSSHTNPAVHICWPRQWRTPRHHRTAVSNSANTVPYLPASARDGECKMLTHACPIFALCSSCHTMHMPTRCTCSRHGKAFAVLSFSTVRASSGRLAFEIASILQALNPATKTTLALAGFTRVTTQPPCMECGGARGWRLRPHINRGHLRTGLRSYCIGRWLWLHIICSLLCRGFCSAH